MDTTRTKDSYNPALNEYTVISPLGGINKGQITAGRKPTHIIPVLS
jgi:hypothetical protein